MNMTANRPCILTTSADPMLLRTRTLILKNAGFNVVARLAISKVRQRSEHIKRAVLGNSIDLDERIALAQHMRDISPNVAIVMLQLPGDRFDASVCDVLVQELAAPDALVRAVQRALNKRETRSAHRLE